MRRVPPLGAPVAIFHFVLPNRLTMYRPTKPVAPKTVTTSPENEERPPRPVFDSHEAFLYRNEQNQRTWTISDAKERHTRAITPQNRVVAMLTTLQGPG